ncbi:MAG: FHA domain-containing protein [Saprospiraceae bacterium]|nr:FHA domain-containing protein [Pyrinomonadaceae bacterium]
MAENTPLPKKTFSPDWLVQGVLTKIGDTFDRLTGRGWQPSSSLATSELVEKLKHFLDAELREGEDRRKFVPHNIKLKMQWDKFSTDSEDALKTLEAELLTAAVDHINDKLYYTYAPLYIEVKPDYFTSGVKLFVSFEKFSEDEREAEIDVSVPGMKAAESAVETDAAQVSEKVEARFLVNGQPKQKELRFEKGRRLSVGRTKENDLTIDDPSVSKIHASLMLDSQSRLLVADTGSTNGTFVDGERISYGKALGIERGTNLKFGAVEVQFEFVAKPVEIQEAPELPKTEAYKIGEFEFTQRIEPAPTAENSVLVKTEPAMLVKEDAPLEAESFESSPPPTKPGIILNLPEEEKSKDSR